VAVRRARPSGELEGEVVACLASARRAMTPAEVRAEIGGELAYTTVMTTLVRLYEKQALTREPRGRAYAYELVGGTRGAKASITAHQMQKLLDAGADRATVLSRFVDGLDPDTEHMLRELLDAHPAGSVPPAELKGTRARGRK
jgi:predicted transcriptional regulator